MSKCYHTGERCTGLNSYCVGCRCNPVANEASLVICYRDELGVITMYVDSCGVQFADGNAVFNDLNDVLHTIPAANIVNIVSAIEY